jgi:ribonuclease HII
VLVDGNRLPKWRYRARAVVGGDALCLSIAAASIVAKHERDCLMKTYDAAHPGYGWARNKGYGTADHRDALERLGPTPLHRRSFAPVAQRLLAL